MRLRVISLVAAVLGLSFLITGYLLLRDISRSSSFFDSYVNVFIASPLFDGWILKNVHIQNNIPGYIVKVGNKDELRKLFTNFDILKKGGVRGISGRLQSIFLTLSPFEESKNIENTIFYIEKTGESKKIENVLSGGLYAVRQKDQFVADATIGTSDDALRISLYLSPDVANPSIVMSGQVASVLFFNSTKMMLLSSGIENRSSLISRYVYEVRNQWDDSSAPFILVKQ